ASAEECIEQDAPNRLSRGEGMLEINKRYREAYKANIAAKGLIDRHAAAALLGITVRTLQRWHHAGHGPKRVSGPGWPSVWYRLSEVEQWKSTVPTSSFSGHQTAEQQDRMCRHLHSVDTRLLNNRMCRHLHSVDTRLLNKVECRRPRTITRKPFSQAKSVDRRYVEHPAHQMHPCVHCDRLTPGIDRHGCMA